MDSKTIGPLSGIEVPRFAGPDTFARLPRADQVEGFDLGVLGVPFDNGTTYRPGARFGPRHVRSSSRMLREFHPEHNLRPFDVLQVADCGDAVCSPYDIGAALASIEESVAKLYATGATGVMIGGDHTITLPILRAVAAAKGPVALIHFDAHLDTFDTFFDAPYTHGNTFRRAFEEGLLLPDSSTHLGNRGPLFAIDDLEDDERFGFLNIRTPAVAADPEGAIAAARERAGDRPVYISVDVDVLDPAFAPGTGTPEAGGLSTRELLALLRGVSGLDIVGADVVEVSPSFDHAEITGVAAATLVYELIALMALCASERVVEADTR